METRLTLVREYLFDKTTIGRLFWDGEFVCFTCEDVDRYLEIESNTKVAGETAIPIGDYHVTITMSNRFNQPMPLISVVKGFSGIRIHAGNSSSDTEGCILLGDVYSTAFPERIFQSRVAFARFFSRLKGALASGPVALTILRKPGVQPAKGISVLSLGGQVVS